MISPQMVASHHLKLISGHITRCIVSNVYTVLPWLNISYLAIDRIGYALQNCAKSCKWQKGSNGFIKGKPAKANTKTKQQGDMTTKVYILGPFGKCILAYLCDGFIFILIFYVQRCYQNDSELSVPHSICFHMATLTQSIRTKES